MPGSHVARIRAGGGEALPPALLGKAWSSRIRHPDLHRAQAGSTQLGAVRLNALVDTRSHHSLIRVCYMQRQHSPSLRYMQPSSPAVDHDRWLPVNASTLATGYRNTGQRIPAYSNWSRDADFFATSEAWSQTCPLWPLSIMATLDRRGIRHAALPRCSARPR